ncbi:hypothetical protein D3C80_1176730 [compost metagenome]
MHRNDRHYQGHRQRQGRRASQQADHQGQAAEEFGTAGQQGHQVTRRQADAFHPLAGAFQAVATEQAEEFLRTMSHEDDADQDADNAQASASTCREQRVEGSVVHVEASLK